MSQVQSTDKAGTDQPSSAKSSPSLFAAPSRSDSLTFAVPAMLFASSAIMALAWLGHLRFKDDVGFLVAAGAAWLLVLPEYALNILALRLGIKRYSGGQMAAFRLCSGVVCIALVSRFVLNEPLTTRKLLGFLLMFVSMFLIRSADRNTAPEN